MAQIATTVLPGFAAMIATSTAAPGGIEGSSREWQLWLVLRRVTAAFVSSYGILFTGGYPPVKYPADIRHPKARCKP
jgi:hypothetical protein